MTQPAAWNTGSRVDHFILVVDSEPQGLISLSMIIQRLGYHACSALGVGNALEMASAKTPCLVITELNLKGLGGLDLLELLRQRPEPVPVIIMARDRTPEIEERCRAAGAAACLEKPVQVTDLYQAIQPIIEPGSRRAHVRIATRLSVTVDDRPLDCADGECVTNLSVNGMHLRTRKAYPVEAQVRIVATLNEEKIEAAARVAYNSPPEEGASVMWGIGLQFLRTSPEAGEIIRRFINDEVTHGIDPK